MEFKKNNKRILIIIGVLLLIFVLTTICILHRITKIKKENSSLKLMKEIEIQTEVPNGYVGITNIDELKAMADNLTGKYILMEDIDMHNEEWIPIGNSNGTNSFRGIFDGNAHIISNLTINSDLQYVGMFGYVGSGGTIKNLILNNVNITNAYISNNSYIGAISGYIQGGTVENISVNGKIQNTGEMEKNQYIGGLVGYTYSGGGINDSNAQVEVKANTQTGEVYAGGLIGYQSWNKITNSYATGNVTVTSTSGIVYAGGLAGEIYYGNTYTNLYATGKVEVNETSNTNYVGGLVGYSTSGSQILNMDKVYSTGDVISNSTSESTYVGGLIGYATAKTPTSSEYFKDNKISNAYTTSNVKSQKGSIGGLIGEAKGGYYGGWYNSIEVKYSYAVGKIVGGIEKGGVIGSSPNHVKAIETYWSPETTGILTSTVGTKKLLNNMLYQDKYSGWDFDTIWQIEEGKTLPYLRELTKPGSVNESNYTYIKYEGEGTEDNPYLIKNIEQLKSLSNGTEKKFYKLANNIDAKGEELFPIGDKNNPFEGVFDGNTYTISNVTINSNTQYVGLFGYIKVGTIKNLNIENVNITSTYVDNVSFIGGLSAYTYNTKINNVNVSGNVNNAGEMEKNMYIGGLIGQDDYGTISDSSAQVEVVVNNTKGQIQEGGLVGEIQGGISYENLYATGNVICNATSISAYTCVGGLIGSLKSSSAGLNLNKAYATGNVVCDATSNNTYVGGLIGYAKTTNATATENQKNIVIDNTFQTGTVNAKTGYVGGLLGYAEGSNVTVSNKNYYNYVYVRYSYTIGKIEGGTNKGSIVGYANNIVVNYCYWNPQLSGIETSSRGTKIENMQDMLEKSTYSGYNFDTIWEQKENCTTPYLRNMLVPIKKIDILGISDIYVGEGTKESPFIIETIEQFIKINDININVYFNLVNDLDASIIEKFEPIEQFKGTLIGDNHTISNININSSDMYTGVFNKNEGTIENLKLNLNITSNYSGEIAYIGGACAKNIGNIKNIEVSGTINNIGTVTNLYVGGIAGQNSNIISKTSNLATINNTGAVTNLYVGGIVGNNFWQVLLTYNKSNIVISNVENAKVGGIAGKSVKTINNCYSKGTQTINANSIIAGGIAGESQGIIKNTYSIDNIKKEATTYTIGGITGGNATVISSYYNISNIESQDEKGLDVTIEALKRQNTFENWNFDEIWKIEEGIDTPNFLEKIYENNENYEENDGKYYEDEFWEWHTRTTSSDQAYNGKHIVINKGESINFYGYGETSYKDYLYKYYSDAGKKIFMFKIDETKANYHTLDGAGFIFNAKKEYGLLSGYVLLITYNQICIYRLDDVNAFTFENASNATIKTYGTLVESVTKTSSKVHNLIITASPTNVSVIDNGQEILNTNLDYSKHVGEDFGLIASYEEHSCNKLSEIQFLEFQMEVQDYSIPILKVDENGNRLSGAKFQVKNEAGEIVSNGDTNSLGIYRITGLQEGIYTLEETESPIICKNQEVSYTFKVNNEGKAINIETGEEISIKIENEKLKFTVKVMDTEENPIEGSKIGIYDNQGNQILDSEGKPVTITTDSDGNAVFTNITEGDYKFKQIDTAKGYIIDDKIYEVKVKKDGEVIFEEELNGIIYNEKATVNVEVTKVWVDTEEQKIHRPANIKIQIMNGETVVEEKIISNTEEGTTFTLPKYDSEGNEITYTIREQEVNERDLKFYTSSVEGNTITNTFTIPDETVSLPITKVWVDNSNSAGKRPEDIKLQLKANGIEQGEEITVTGEGDTWNYTFESLPKYDEDGNEIAYTAIETSTNKFYEMTQEGNTITNTFKVPVETVDVEVTKIWIDTEEQRVHRPETITIRVMNGEILAQEKTITNSETGATFSLPKYDNNGNEIEYTIEEVSNSKFYESSVEGNTITNTFKVPVETVSLPIIKIWSDNSNSAGKRPENIKLQLKANGVEQGDEVIVAGEGDTWNYTFENLPKYDENGNEITYTAEETSTDKFYEMTQEGNIITNTFTVPSETVSLPITKVWVDNSNSAGKRPEDIKLQLKANGVEQGEEVTLTGEGDTWNYTFESLPKYDEDGNEIAYTAIETSTNEFYEITQEGNTITNTFTVSDETIDLDVTKVWVDTEEQRVHRPENIKIQVMNGETVVDEKVISNTEEGTTFTLPKYDSEGNEITYTIREQEVNERDLKFYTSSVEGNTITNTFTIPDETVSLPITKVWVDNSNSAGKRPENIKLQLKANGVEQGDEVIVAGEGDTWNYTFENLPKYDENGNEITYTAEETSTNKFYEMTQEGNTITNTIKQIETEKVELTIQKEWVDDNNKEGKRPTSIIIVIKNNDEEITQIELTQENAITNNIWEAKVSNLEKYNSNGTIINYTIDEKEKNIGDLTSYIKTIQGNKVINTLKKAKYIVEHYRRTLDIEVEGYELVDTEDFEGIVGKIVTATPKNYLGYVENTLHPNRIPSGVIQEDGNLILRLYYEREEYSITYELNGGTATRGLVNSYIFGQEVYLSRKVEKNGYEFAGWYYNEEFNGNAITKIEAEEKGNKILYAKWIQKSVSSEIYNVDEVKNQISGVDSETTVGKLLQNLQISNSNVKVYNLEGQEVLNDNLVGTGYIIKVGNDCEYQIAVKGDLDGNGKVTVTDLSMMNQAMTNKRQLNSIQETAIDFDNNEKITVTDLSMMNKLLTSKDIN